MDPGQLWVVEHLHRATMTAVHLCSPLSGSQLLFLLFFSTYLSLQL